MARRPPHPYRADLLLFAAAAIWGSAFVAQRLGMDHIGPLFYSGLRFLAGALAILPIAWTRPRAVKRHGEPGELAAGALLGALVAFGVNLQQMGLQWTSVANAGFITGLYVIVVPMLGLFTGQRAGRGTWSAALLAVVGLYLLSVGDRLRVAPGDWLELGSTVFWAAQMLLAGRVAPGHDPLRLACIQYTVCGAISLLVAACVEPLSLDGARAALPAILYGGLLSVACAYTLQLVAQKDVIPAHAAVIMSLEGGFAALTGWWILGQAPSARAIAGGALMIVAMLVAQFWRGAVFQAPGALAPVGGGRPPGGGARAAG